MAPISPFPLTLALFISEDCLFTLTLALFISEDCLFTLTRTLYFSLYTNYFKVDSAIASEPNYVFVLRSP